ncbi:hypothetical protein SAMN05443661_102119 [Natronobacterium gregoryi]|uniref:Uncharacterized protein n=1 Tax=Natronobacterium gregoryi TaxID=44930 RepID=A0A1I3JIY4_9EURY|nr:hypothetical protein SAMN05443661_102119 [Natronobacterium gregoryi]
MLDSIRSCGRFDALVWGGPPLVLSQPSTDGSDRATPPDSTHQFRLGPPLEPLQRERLDLVVRFRVDDQVSENFTDNGSKGETAPGEAGTDRDL